MNHLVACLLFQVINFTELFFLVMIDNATR